MKFLRTEILGALKTIEPAIASKELISQFVHVWFDGTTVTAYNDVIGIEVPFATDFAGGMRGSVLLGILANSGATNVEVKAGKEGEMLLKAAGAHVNLTVLPPDEALFKFPTLAHKPISFDAKFVAAIARVSVSIGHDVSVPEQLGITVVVEGDRLKLLTTDSKSIARMYVAKPEGWNEPRITIPASFCSALVRMYKDGGELSVRDRDIVASSAGGKRLFARLVDVPRPLDFDAIIEAAVEGIAEAVPIPETLDRALDRVSVLLDGRNDSVLFFVEDNSVGMFAKSKLGEIDDVIKLKSGTHKDIEQRLDHTLIKRVIDCCDKFLLLNDCLVMTGPDEFLYLISLS